MKNRRNLLFLAMIFFIFGILAVGYQLSDTDTKRMEQAVLAENKIGVHKGDVALDFTLLNEKGESKSLSTLKGKKVVINFFATWCEPCLEEMPTLVSLHQNAKERGIVVLGVNMTSVERNPNDVSQFLKHLQADFEVLYDGDGKVMKDYQLIGIPTTILIDEKGRIAERINGILTEEMVQTYAFFQGE